MDLVDNVGIARIKPWYEQWQDHCFVGFVLVLVLIYGAYINNLIPKQYISEARSIARGFIHGFYILISSLFKKIKVFNFNHSKTYYKFSKIIITFILVDFAWIFLELTRLMMLFIL